MKISKKLIAMLIVVVAVCGVVFAQLIAQYEFTNTMSIKGVGVDVWEWIDDLTMPTTLVTSHDWDTVAGGETIYYEFVVLENYGTEGLTLEFVSDLNSSIGTVKWWIEWSDNGNWLWKDWQQCIDDGILYVPGQPGNPFGGESMLGLRPETPEDNDMGRVRLSITIDLNAPFGAVDPFTITVIGTEYIA